MSQSSEQPPHSHKMEEPCKDYLYGRYQKMEDWKNGLHKKATHKALDIPMEEAVNVDNSRVGLGWKELAVIAATGLGGLWLYDQRTTEAPAPTQVAPVDSEYDVMFYDADGNKIDVPHISTRGADE